MGLLASKLSSGKGKGARNRQAVRCAEFSVSCRVNVFVLLLVILCLCHWFIWILCFVLFQHQAVSKVVVLDFRGPLKACKAISDEGVLCICSLVQINLTNRW